MSGNTAKPLSVVAGVALLGVVAWLGWWLATAEPAAPNDPGAVTAGGNGVAAATGGTVAADGAVHQDSGAVRVAVPAALGGAVADADAPCELVVVVETMHANAPTRLPFAEVRAALDDTDVIAVGRADAAGTARFSFTGGHERTVTVTAANGARATGTLLRGERVSVNALTTARVLVRGRVVAAGVGVADATVQLLRWDADDATGEDRVWDIGQSGPDGGFEIPLALGGRVGATHPAYGPSALHFLSLRTEGATALPTQTFELVLRPERVAARGVVRARSGAPIAGAKLELRPTGPLPNGAELVGPPRRATTDDDGAFEVLDLPPGGLQWVAHAAGYGWATGEAEPIAHGTHLVDVTLPLPGRIVGTVRDAAGAPVVGAEVTAVLGDGLCQLLTKTNGDGAYALVGAGAGRVELTARFGGQRVEAERQLRAEGEARWDARFGAMATVDGPSVRGVVVDERNRPLAGWRVDLRARGGREVGETDARGEFSVRVPGGATRGLDLRVYAPGRAAMSFADAVVRGVPADSRQRVVVPTGRTSLVRGRVIGHDGRGVPAHIECWHEPRREYARFAANEDGAFELPDVPVGALTLTFSHPTQVPFEVDDVRIEAGVPVDLPTITLQLGGGLEGAVVGPGGAPAECELVLLVGDRRVQAAYENGSYRFADVLPGEHSLLVQGAQFAAQSTKVSIVPGVVSRQDIEVRVGCSKRARVFVPGGGGERVTLAIRAKGSTQALFVKEGRVARDDRTADGVATFLVTLDAGTYEFAARTPPGLRAKVDVTFSPNDARDVVLRVQR